MPNTLEIKRRIKSVGNTKKITRAMEMVSAAKMRRAVDGVLKVRDYARTAWSVLTNLARAFENGARDFPLLEVREVRSVLMIVIASNKGLCGSFNSQVVKKIKDQLSNPKNLSTNRVGEKKIEPKDGGKNLKVDFVAVGKKGEAMVRKLGVGKLIASFPNLTYLPKIGDVYPLVKIIQEEYVNKNYDKVVIVYTDYVSTMVQQTKVRQLLPISKIDIEKQLAEMDQAANDYGLRKPKSEYKVEPSPEVVLEEIFPRLIEMQIFHAILESNASKESARMLAMRNATDAAGEMVDDLTFAYNQIRQGKITQEISEISAGRAALEG